MTESNEHSRIGIESVAKRLPQDLINLEIATTAAKEDSNFDHLFYDGFNELIDRFNQLNLSDSEMSILPNAVSLKEILANKPLPNIEELSLKELIYGIKEAGPLMHDGQKIYADETLDPTPENKQKAIGSPTIIENPIAIAVGSAGHILERTIFNYLRSNSDISSEILTKDLILFVLEDIALLTNAEGNPSILFPLISTSIDEGGLGWRGGDAVKNMIEEYQKIEIK